MSPALPLDYRRATPDDSPLLAQWNHQLIREERHRNTMSLPELETRLRGWLAGEYHAVIFTQQPGPVAYALYRVDPAQVYLRQFFVRPDRRRSGLGRAAMRILHSVVWPRDRRLTVEVLSHNQAGVAFWRAAGYQDYSLTLEVMPSGLTPHDLARGDGNGKVKGKGRVKVRGKVKVRGV